MTTIYEEKLMIKPTHRNDVIIGDENEPTPLICSHTDSFGVITFVVARGKNLKLFDGNATTATLKLQFTLEFEIKKIFFHSLALAKHIEKSKKDKEKSKSDKIWKDTSLKKRDYLVVCGENRLLFIANHDSHFYHYEIPFKLRNVFSFPGGVLVERFYDATSKSVQYHDTFHLYSLSGPFGELLPVIYKTLSRTPCWKFCWQSQQDDAEMVATDRNFVVVYDQIEKVHRVYISRETKEQEVQAAVRYVEVQRKSHQDSTLYAGSIRTPQQMFESSAAGIHNNGLSPAMIALSEVINSDIDGRSPHVARNRMGFGHSTPNNYSQQHPYGSQPLPTPNFDNESDLFSPAGGTPRIGGRGNGGHNLERNIHTRSLVRMTNTDGAGSSRNTRMSAYSPNTTPTLPYKKWKRTVENAELLREFTRMIRDTPRQNKTKKSSLDFGDLERDPDLDLLLSKVCLECIYVEPDKRLESAVKADKVFISHCLSQSFVNIVKFDKNITIIPIWGIEKVDDKKRIGENKIVVSCKDATIVEKTGLTVIYDLESSISLYGGAKKISLVYVSNQPLGNVRLSPFAPNAFSIYSIQIPPAPPVKKTPPTPNKILPTPDRDTSTPNQSLPTPDKTLPITDQAPPTSDQAPATTNPTPFTPKQTVPAHVQVPLTPKQTLTTIELPPAFSSESVHEMMKTCFTFLPSDVSQDIICKWRAISGKSQQSPNELENVLQFLLSYFGVEFEQRLEREASATPEAGGKHMRPHTTSAEMMDKLNAFVNSCNVKIVDEYEEREREVSKREFLVNIETTSTNMDHLRSLFMSLHAVFEDWTVQMFRQEHLTTFVIYLNALAKILNEHRHSEYYERLFKTVFNKVEYTFNSLVPVSSNYKQSEPFIIIKTLREISGLHRLPNLPEILNYRCMKLISIVLAGSGMLNSPSDADEWRDRLGLSSRAMNVFDSILRRKSRDSEKATSLIRFFKFEMTDIQKLTMGLRILLLKYESEAFSGVKSLEPTECVFADEDEIFLINQTRWKHDIRMKNVEIMLDSSKQPLIATNILMSDETVNMKELQDQFLTQTSIRYFAQSFGRAFFEFRTEVPSLLQPLEFSRMALAGFLYPSRVTCDLPASEMFRINYDWAHFYNCTASTLKVGSSDMVKIDPEWMSMTRKACKTVQSSSGLILGLGLNGHLANINMYDAHQLLSKFERFQSVALLLGLAASKLKTCDNQVYKILATHLQFLMGPTLLEIRMDCNIQTAAVCALGLVFADSGHTNIAKKLANEIGKSPNIEDEPIPERVAYKLGCGIALGLIMLGKGNGIGACEVPFKQAIPSLSSRLICMMNGGLKSQCVFLPQSNAPTTAEGVTCLPFGTLTQNGNGPTNICNQIPNHVQEGSGVNVHLSSQAATLALGLMFMKTNNKFIGEKLALPASVSELEKIRPDFIFLRVLCYCIVMWDSMEIHDDWVNNRVPDVVQRFMLSSLNYGEDNDSPMTDDEHEYWDDIVDRHTIAQVYLYAIAGACTAIALKYSGAPENDENKAAAALQMFERFASIVLPEEEIPKRQDYTRLCKYAGQTAVSSCFSSMVLAMGIVMAGTGNKTVIRYARFLRMAEKLEKDSWLMSGRKHYEQMVAHQTLGMLFMGGGRYALKKDNVSLALLITSFLPVIPANVSDNTHYHQPLRFMWALAGEPRLLVPYDSNESTVVECDCLISMKDKSNPSKGRYVMKAPCLTPPLEDIEFLELGGGCYELVRINLNTAEELKSMRQILSVGQGRINLRRFISTNVDAPRCLQALISDSYLLEPARNDFDLNVLLRLEKTTWTMDDVEFSVHEMQLKKELRLNGAEKYPQIQSHLNTFRDEIERTTKEMAGLQISNVELAQTVVDGWSNEVNVATKLHEIAQGMRK